MNKTYTENVKLSRCISTNSWSFEFVSSIREPDRGEGSTYYFYCYISVPTSVLMKDNPKSAINYALSLVLSGDVLINFSL